MAQRDGLEFAGPQIDLTPIQVTFLAVDATGFVVTDNVPPTVDVLSPTPGVAPGNPGGFSSDFDVAKVTPIVLRLNDLSPGLRYVCIVAEFPASAREIVFRRGAFVEPYTGSTYIETGTQADLTVVRSGGWPSPVNGAFGISFAIDAIDKAGNII